MVGAWMRLIVRWSAAAAVCAAAAAPAGGQTVSYSGSAQYATGTYIFADRTHSVYVTNGLDLSHGRLQAAVSLPLIYQTSPWVSYSVVGSVPSGGPQHGAVGGSGPGAESGGSGTGRRRGRAPIVLPDTATYADVGIGDPSLRVDVTLRPADRTGPRVRLAAGLKAPLADVDRGFGTGAWDGGLGVAVSQRLGRWLLLGDAMHWWLGDMDELVLDNAVAYSVSVGRALHDGQIGLLASVAGYAAAIVDDVDPPLQGALGISYGFGAGRYGLTASASIGLTAPTPDLALAVGWRATL